MSARFSNSSSSIPMSAEKFSNGARGVLRPVERFRHWMNANTKSGSKTNISAHYDLGNAFYKRMARSDDDLFVGALFDGRQRPGNRRRRQVPGAWRDAAGIKAGRSRAGDRLRLGRFCRIRGARNRLQGDRPDDQPRTAGLRQRAHRKTRASPTRSRSSSRITATRPAPMTGSSRSRCSRLSAKNTGRLTSRKLQRLPEAGRHGRPADHHHQAGSLSTTIAANPDFIQKYVFPGGMLPTPQASGRSRPQGGSCRSAAISVSGRIMPARWPNGATASGRVWDKIEPLGFDDALQAALGILPVLLRGRLPRQQHRRPPGRV